MCALVTGVQTCALPISRLAIEPGRLERWRLWLDARRQGRPAVGICWRSGHRNRHRNPHYMSVAEIAACIPPDTLVVNLQYSWEEQEEIGRASWRERVCQYV